MSPFNFVDYNKTCDIIEITIRDCTGRKIETFKANVHDKKACSKLFDYLKKAYDFQPEIYPDEFDEEEKEKIKKINWFG